MTDQAIQILPRDMYGEVVGRVPRPAQDSGRSARVSLYADRFEQGLDLWTGEPLDVQDETRESQDRTAFADLFADALLTVSERIEDSQETLPSVSRSVRDALAALRLRPLFEETGAAKYRKDKEYDNENSVPAAKHDNPAHRAVPGNTCDTRTMW